MFYVDVNVDTYVCGVRMWMWMYTVDKISRLVRGATKQHKNKNNNNIYLKSETNNSLYSKYHVSTFLSFLFVPTALMLLIDSFIDISIC